MLGRGRCRPLVGIGAVVGVVAAPLTMALVTAGPAGALTTISVTTNTDRGATSRLHDRQYDR